MQSAADFYPVICIPTIREVLPVGTVKLSRFGFASFFW
jgi:hypothetical protein